MRLSILGVRPGVPGVLLCFALAMCLAGPACNGPAAGTTDASAASTASAAKSPSADGPASTDPDAAKTPASDVGFPPVAAEVKPTAADLANPPDADGATSPADEAAAKEALAVLDRMLAVYRGAQAYRDQGEIVMRIHGADGVKEHRFDSHLDFQRPNLFRSEVRQAWWPTLLRGEPAPQVLVVADGKRIYAKPEGYDSQVVVLPDPARITVPELFATEVFESLMQVGVTGQSVPLNLLAAEKPMQELNRKTARLQTPAEIDGQTYDRVRLGPRQAPVTLWINPKTSVLRRVEYATDEVRKMLEPDKVTGVELTAEFVSAALDPPAIAGQFSWQKKPDEHLVGQLVDPPEPLNSPLELLGQPVPDFSFVNAAGEKGGAKSFDGKITVIDFWATWCGYCIKGMPGLEQVRKKYANNDKVRFVALSVDTPDVPDADIAAVLKKLGVEVPWVRSTLEEPGKLYGPFHFDGIPAMLILGADGRVQFHHVGMDPEITDTLPQKIDALLSGEDLSKESVEAWAAQKREYQQKVDEYHHKIELASVDNQTSTIEIPRAKIADRSEPKTFRLRPLWTAADVKSPGNILVVESAGDPPRLLVIDNWHEIVELDAAGKVVARHKDLVPGNPPFSFLRTAVGRDGKRLFVVGAIGQNQFHVFDAQWKRLLSYPAEGSAQIFDVQPADLGDSGQPQLDVGYFGAVGVQGVSLDGRRLWRNRSLENVASLAVTGPDAAGKRRLLCVHDGGTVVPIRDNGQADAPVRYVDHAITHILAADLAGDGKQEYCAIAANAAGERAVVGLRVDENGGEVTWQHQLPRGEHERPVEVLSTAHLVPGQPGQWLVSAADGSIHIVSHDGSTRDQFNSGASLTGLSAATFDGQPVLLVSHPDGLSALAVEKLP